MLMLHDGAGPVTDAILANLPAPVPRGSFHRPVPHGALVGALKDAAAAHGYIVARQALGLNRSGQRLFGVIDLIPPSTVPRPSDLGWSIGFRNSTDESLGIRIVAGVRVFVCDNLALSGDLIALKRRNTTGLDLTAALAEGFERYLTHARALDHQVTELQNARISGGAAKSLIVNLFSDRILPLRLFHPVVRYYFNPDESMTDCQPSTRWGLLNACTRALKLLPPARAFTANVALGHAFGLSHVRR